MFFWLAHRGVAKCKYREEYRETRGLEGPCKHSTHSGHWVKCGKMHHQSVHGCIAVCNNSHPLVKAWIESWPLSIQTKIKQWRTIANQRDRFILGKLCIPSNLRQCFKEWKISWRDSRKMIRKFQNTVTDKMQPLLPLRDTYTHKRPNPWEKLDWTREHKLHILNPFSHRI